MYPGILPLPSRMFSRRGQSPGHSCHGDRPEGAGRGAHHGSGERHAIIQFSGSLATFHEMTALPFCQHCAE